MRHGVVPLRVLAFIVAFGIVAGSGQVASASAIGPGTDLFVTVPGTAPGVGTEVDLSFLLPSVGVIALEGVPILPGGVDTVVERLQGIDPLNICPTLPCSDVIDIEIVALSLTSIDPVDLSDLGGPFIGLFADVFFTINKGGAFSGLPQPDALNPSIGQMQIAHDNALGGSFQSCFGNLTDPTGMCGLLGVAGGGVYANAIFTVVGGDPSNPLDVFFSAAGPRIALSGTGVWVHGGGPDDFAVTSVTHACYFSPCHVVVTPEPSTPALLGAGLLVLLASAARRRRRTA